MISELLAAMVFYVNLSFDAPQGRYFFGALNVIAVLLVFGLAELLQFLRRPLIVAAPAFLLLTNLYSLWLVWSIWLLWAERLQA